MTETIRGGGVATGNVGCRDGLDYGRCLGVVVRKHEPVSGPGRPLNLMASNSAYVRKLGKKNYQTIEVIGCPSKSTFIIQMTAKLKTIDTNRFES
jgi:hypothetical protein